MHCTTYAQRKKCMTWAAVQAVGDVELLDLADELMGGLVSMLASMPCFADAISSHEDQWTHLVQAGLCCGVYFMHVRYVDVACHV